MARLYVIRNQNAHYLSTDLTWIDGGERQSVFRTPHRDVALNELFERTLDDAELRAEVLEVSVDTGDQPKIEVLNPAGAPLQPAEDVAA